MATMEELREFDNTITYGDRVRSYDFPDSPLREQCYVEGVVEGVKHLDGCRRYVIKVERVVWSGVERPLNEFPERVFPPCNGTYSVFSGKPTNGVERI